MTSKRKFKEVNNDEPCKKHTLDSDEEDSDDYEKDDINESDIEGEEDGVANVQDEVKITPFNMREELQEGHFDKDGHYHWNKDSEIKDNWLDNIDWVKVKNDKNYLNPHNDDNSNNSTGIGLSFYNEAHAYTQVLHFMEPHETVQKTLQRLGKSRTKINSAERLRRKKLGITDEAAEKITHFTELTNEILTRTGNMDIYQETYEQIKDKVNNLPSTSKMAQFDQTTGSDPFDMYADDFAVKEKQRLEAEEKPEEKDKKDLAAVTLVKKELLWEFKWKQDDNELQGPYSTEKMMKWAQDNYFKKGVYVRKVGETTPFYSSNRIDFDLYL